MGVIVLVYFNKIISLPAPLLYCVFDRFVLLHKIPNICRLYPYFSMLFRFSICQLFVLLKVRPMNQITTDAQRKPKKELVPKKIIGGKSFYGCQETINLANQVVGNTMAYCILKSCFLVRTKLLSPLRKARKCELASYIIFSPLKLSPRLIDDTLLRSQLWKTRRRRLPKWILLSFQNFVLFCMM